MDAPTINPLEVDFKNLLEKNKNFFMMLCGKRRTGKTFLLRDILYQTKDWYEDVHIFSSTMEYQQDVYDFCPRANAYNEFRPDIIESIYKQQRSRLSGMSQSEKKDKHLRLIILDDVAHLKKVINCPILKELATAGRHNNFCVILITQYLKLFEPTIRQNNDLVFTFPMSGTNLEVFAKDYILGKTNREKMDILSSIVRQEFTCCMVDLASKSLKLEDSVYAYKAKEVPKFKIGAEKEQKKKKNAAGIYSSNIFSMNSFF